MTPEQEEQIKKLRLGCYLNAAMVKSNYFFIFIFIFIYLIVFMSERKQCYLKLKLWKKTADNATYALELDPTNTKVCFNFNF